MTPPLTEVCSNVLLEHLGKAIKRGQRTAVFACGGSIPVLTGDGGSWDGDASGSGGAEAGDGGERGRDNSDQSSDSDDSDYTEDEEEDDEDEDTEEDGEDEEEQYYDEEDKMGREGLDDIITVPAVTLRWDGIRASTGFKAQLPLLNPDDFNSLDQLISDCQPATFGQGGRDVFDESYRKAMKMDKAQFATDFSPYETGIIDTIAQVLLPSAASGGGKRRGVRAELYKLNIYSAPSGKFRAHVDTPRHKSQFGSLVVCLPYAHKGGALVVRHKSSTVTFDWSNMDVPSHSSIRWAAFYSDCEHEVLEVTSGHRITLTYNLYVSRGTGTLTGHRMSLDPTKLPLFTMAKEVLGKPGFLPEGHTLGVYCSHAYAHTNSGSIKYLPSSLKGIDMAIYETFHALGCSVRLVPISEVDSQSYDPSDRMHTDRYMNIVGTKLHGLTEADHFLDEGEAIQGVLERYWPHTVEHGTYWLNKRVHKEPALMYMAYGNEPSIQLHYSYAALLIQVPPSRKRDITASCESTSD